MWEDRRLRCELSKKTEESNIDFTSYVKQVIKARKAQSVWNKKFELF